MAEGYPPLCQCHADTPGGRALHHLDNIGKAHAAKARKPKEA
jgi:hypothetical protein